MLVICKPIDLNISFTRLHNAQQAVKIKNSKHAPDIVLKLFLGATDSAVPCAMMINLAAVMSKQLDKLKNSSPSLMFIFFDGEEAFRQWGPRDSIYGARHLAKMWHGMPYKDGASHLQRMVSFNVCLCFFYIQ